MLKYIVTGTGRCGTVFVARLLTSLGITCGHESIFDYLGLEEAIYRIYNNQAFNSYASTHNLLNNTPHPTWADLTKIQADSSYMAAPFLNHQILKDTKIIHVVRNPLEVISSFVLDFHFFTDHKDIAHYRKFVYNILPILETPATEIERACLYYTLWNQMIEKTDRTYLFLNIENQNRQSLYDFLEIAQIPENIFDDSKINSNKRRTNQLTLKDIPDGEIKNNFIALGNRYGYFPKWI